MEPVKVTTDQPDRGSPHSPGLETGEPIPAHTRAGCRSSASTRTPGGCAQWQRVSSATSRRPHPDTVLTHFGRPRVP